MAQSGNGRGGDRNKKHSAEPVTLGDRLADFTARLGTARGKRASGPEAEPRRNPMGVAFRIGTELLGGVLVGGLIGWQLDRWLGTLPVMLIIFLLLGGAAGIWTVIRSALKMQADAKGVGRETNGPGSSPGG